MIDIKKMGNCLFKIKYFSFNIKEEAIIIIVINTKVMLAPLDPRRSRQNVKADKVKILKTELILILAKVNNKKGNLSKKLNAVILIFPVKDLRPIVLENFWAS